ncbi:gustatory receptor for sugar taste 64e-like [Schistocerca cancellata]|uniref:gustatory receptor for sugar taste 64e-like n=1 Tax=Schistocerca cancellata TaxID=274614 RepID=UPI002117B736|nr:gustatory receptor for sugar taste 64e-like [Schistocerca cancellata]
MPRIPRDVRRRGASLHEALRPMLVAAQVFALMPVEGLRHASPASLRYRWLSFRTAYSLVMALGSALMVVTHVMWLTETSFAFSNTSPGVFFMCHVLTSLLFIQLARGWPDLMAQWWAMDATVPSFSPRLPKLFYIITCVLMLTALAEHILARLFNVVHAYECSPGGLSWLQLYLANEFPSAYHYIGFSYWTSAWLATINTAATFSWNYMDLFLILISLALADRFEHFNQDIARVFDRAVPQKIWQRIRENYCSLAHLAHATNARINKIVLLSFTTNLYFICYQLLNSLS